MPKRFLNALVLLPVSIFILTCSVVAEAQLESSTLTTPGTSRTLMLPAHAENSAVISLGSALDPGTGLVVEGLAIIHRREALGRVEAKARSGQTKCYGFMASGAKWKTTEPWLFNPSNVDGVSESSAFTIMDSAISKWEFAAETNVMGSGSSTNASLVADTVSPDNVNEAYFAYINDPGTIAVTIVWGVFGGPTFNRRLVEWDQVYDDVSFNWSAQLTGVEGKMDLENIVTHEIGHSFGMADLYNTCVDETMYGYASNGETKKRDLNTGDVTGIRSLY